MVIDNIQNDLHKGRCFTTATTGTFLFGYIGGDQPLTYPDPNSIPHPPSPLGLTPRASIFCTLHQQENERARGVYLYPSTMQGFNHFFEFVGSFKGSTTSTCVAAHRGKEVYCRVAPCINLEQKKQQVYKLDHLAMVRLKAHSL